MDKKIFRLALPNIISNITVPLLGMIDISIAGHLGSAIYIGAIALGSNIFNMLYWNFGFLRMSSSGFTAQAYGARDFGEAMNVLLRALIVAFGFGLLIVVLQIPIEKVALNFIKSGAETKENVQFYFRICVWSAPAVLAVYAFNGWFIGMQNAKTPMIIAILNNVLNIVLSFTFVFVFDMKIKGIALGTMLSQLITFAVTITLWFKFYGRLRIYIKLNSIFNTDAIKLFSKVNSDVFIRTFMLTLVTTFFTFASSSMGDTILAVNALLMQFFMLFSYFMDGFAYAGEALTGRYIGAKSELLLRYMIRRLFFWGFIVSAFSAVLYIFFPRQILQILTNNQEVISVATSFIFWTILIPITGFAAFLWDGIFIGATASKEMRNAMILSAMSFFVCYYSTKTFLGNNSLWLSFIVYLLMRSVVQTLWARKALRVRVKN
ncbi:MAG: MATE family efflux transporter [Dysgonamonadaceae bacterium]|nr:MATE family efflux transporter [Dysgonamonadaceae bacterium]MDD4605441.1 MATE family efflux transporter [Dysgonamonadaceae bacterium]